MQTLKKIINLESRFFGGCCFNFGVLELPFPSLIFSISDRFTW